ncbi:MAG: hypothetical protein AB1765_10485 [Candidatus Hydrogenedentota bacterium]
MKDYLIVYYLWKFYKEIEGLQEGLKTKVIMNFYGTDCDFIRDIYGYPSPSKITLHNIDHEIKSYLEEAGFRTESKSMRDFEVYILYNSAGSFQGHYSGKPEIIGGKRMQFTGRFEEFKDYQFIHLILPSQYEKLIKLCEIKEAGLNKKADLLFKFPLLTSSTFLYTEYLKSIYSSATTISKKPISEILKLIDTDESISDFLKQKEELDSILSRENRTCIYSVEDGRLKIYDSRSKRTRRCLNAWMFGEEKKELPKKEKKPEEEIKYRDYEKIAEQLSIANRIKLLLEEGRFLVSQKYPVELIDLLVDIKRDIVIKILEHLKSISSDPETVKNYPPEQMQKTQLILNKASNYFKLCDKYPAIVTAYGGNADAIKSYYTPIVVLFRLFHIE